jgi:ATP-dependent Clp protease ATP-binding subunit ClpA
MNVRHSSSLFLIWQVAEFEARQLKASTIEPTHLLLGLSKTVDLDLTVLVPKDIVNRDEVLEECLREVRRLRNVFRNANLNAASFRRRMRSVLGEQRFSLEQSGRLHRSPAARKLFTDAEHLAQLADHVIYPVHLLYTVLTVKDSKRDEVLKELRIDKKRLRDAIKQELLFQWVLELTKAQQFQTLKLTEPRRFWIA